jgi:putative DNA primase/helicase
MIEGSLEWRRIGLRPPKAVTEATERYLASEDDLATWIGERCVEDATAETASSKLYADWKEWAETTGRRGGAGSQKAFSQALEDARYPKRKTEAVMVFGGLKLAPRPAFGGSP